MTKLVASLLIAATADGGFPAIYAERAQLLMPAGNWEDSACYPLNDGGMACDGAWVPVPRLETVGGELASLRADNASLRASPAPPWAVLVGFGLGLLFGGAAVGYLWLRFR